MSFGILRPLHRGDTLVEVMIALVIISSVLAGAFGVTQKSTIAVRNSQEQSEIMQLIQGQIELVRSKALLAESTDDPIFEGSGHFCIDRANGSIISFPGGYSLDNPDTYPNGCNNLGQGGLYAVAVHYDTSQKQFKAEGHWNGLSGSVNSLSMYYRISPGSVPTAAIPGPLPLPGPPPVLAPDPISCENLATIATLRTHDLWDFNGSDSHVYFKNPSDPGTTHPISNAPYLFTANGGTLLPGTYQYFAVSKDNSYAPTGVAKRLHYVGVNSATGNRTFVTSDTPNLPPTKLPGYPSSPEAASTGFFTIAEPTDQLFIEHEVPPNPASTDDAVDGACLAITKK